MNRIKQSVQPFIVVITTMLLIGLFAEDANLLFTCGGNLQRVYEDYTGRGAGGIGLYYLETTWERGTVALQKKAIGRSTSEIEIIFGKPRATDGPILLKGWPPQAGTCEENWLYDVGGTNLLMSFTNHKCIAVETYEYRLDLDWQELKAKRDTAFAVGQTKSAIQKFVRMPLRKVFSADQFHQKKFRSADEVWTYYPGYSTSVSFAFHGDLCVGAEEGAIFH